MTDQAETRDLLFSQAASRALSCACVCTCTTYCTADIVRECLQAGCTKPSETCLHVSAGCPDDLLHQDYLSCPRRALTPKRCKNALLRSSPVHITPSAHDLSNVHPTPHASFCGPVPAPPAPLLWALLA